MAVHQHGARAALGGVTADMGAGQLQLLTDQLHQQGVRWHVSLLALAVDLKFYLHGVSSPVLPQKKAQQRVMRCLNVDSKPIVGDGRAE
jgi:hypothetical protein